MTNAEVKNGFDEIYNQFWNRYKDHICEKDSDEWERIRTIVIVLRKKYPFMKEIVEAMEFELDQRMRRKMRND